MKVCPGLDTIIKETGYIGRNCHENTNCMSRYINMNWKVKYIPSHDINHFDI
jgi:hypothetical protein